MNNIPFLWVNLAALCTFILMFAVLMAAKKTREIAAFSVLITDCVIWTGGTILMRLQMWPGLRFWYYVSLLAIFVMETLFYLFLHSFSHERGSFVPTLIVAATLLLVPGTLTGFFLAPPTVADQGGGKFVYSYQINWHMLFPGVLFVAIIFATLRLLQRMAREQGPQASGAWLLFFGGLIMLLGNFAQIGIPGNIFPLDTLAGVVFAGMVTFALYRRRLFRMTLVVSRGLLMIALAAVCALASSFVITPLLVFCRDSLRLEQETAAVLAALVLALLLIGAYLLFHRMIDALFTRESQQNRLLQSFTADVSQMLSTDAIMERTANVLRQELPAEQIYFCIREQEGYRAHYSSNPLVPAAFMLPTDSPRMRYLCEREPCLLMRDFAAVPHTISDWVSEKELFRRLEIDCMGALRCGDQVEGVAMLSARNHERAFTPSELSFLETVCSIAAIALKNASLYEKVFREARVDSLTGTYNYHYFVETLERQFQKYGRDCLTLLYLDVDDFKLYNQLYGASEGDDALCRICEILRLCAGEQPVYRTSGKVFAMLLPGQDAQHACTLAGDLRRRIAGINAGAERSQYKTLTVSIGICSAPYAASTAKELMDNADLAVYHAKQSQKNQVVVFHGSSTPGPEQLTERTEALLSHFEKGEEGGGNTVAMISALTAAIDAKDHYTYAHSKNVAHYAATLAVAAGLNDEQVRAIYAAGLLHDIGKISVPEKILNKTDQLDTEEYAVMKSHVNNSIEMIRHLPDMDYLIPAVLGHHERWDGKGYPRGIARDEIPVSACCLSIADVFDAMTTDRPYRSGLPLERALSEIREGAGTQFNPELATIFVQLVQTTDIWCRRCIPK